MNNAIGKKKNTKLFIEKLPSVISSDREHAQMIEVVTPLMMRHLTLNVEERNLLRKLIKLIANYEEIRFANEREPLTPLDMLEHMMDSHSHTAKDIWEVIGDKGTVSKILKGDRAISKAQAKRLGAFYHISPALFI